TVLFIMLDVVSRAGDLQFSNLTSGVSVRLNAVADGRGSNFASVGTNSVALNGTIGSAGLFFANDTFPATNLNLRALTYGSGMFVVGGQNSAVFASTNGTIWTPQSNAFPSGFEIAGLAFNTGSNGTFVAVSDSAVIRWADT